MRLSSSQQRLLLFAAQGLTSFAGTMLSLSIFFYMQQRFGWGTGKNFELAAGQGVFYIIGALAAGRVAHKFSREKSLVMTYVLLAVVDLTMSFAPSGWMVAMLLVLDQLIVATSWPAMESLCISSPDPHEMSRRMGIYNLVWSITAAIAVAIGGTILKFAEGQYFMIVAGMQGIAALLIIIHGKSRESATAAHEAPPEELQHKRKLALWLSRVAMPATYVVVYGMSAAMPELPALQHMGPEARTLISSAWLVGRVLAFVLFGATIFWHTRPMLMLLASILMVPAFMGVVALPLGGMIACQVVLGLLIGAIYCASLYFGLVLSEGSTEHAGYHEALIGLGSVLGPGAGAMAAIVRPGDLGAGVGAVTAVVALSALATIVVSVRATNPSAR